MNFPRAREWLRALRLSHSVCVRRWRLHRQQASRARQPHPLRRVQLFLECPRVKWPRPPGPLQPLPGPVRFCQDPGNRFLPVCGRRSPFVWLLAVLRPQHGPRLLRSHRPCRPPAPQRREHRWPAQVWLVSQPFVLSCRRGLIWQRSFHNHARRVRARHWPRGQACRCASKVLRHLDSLSIEVPFVLASP
jgi:hypothetical protein